MDGVNECVIEWIKGEEVANVTAANRTRLKTQVLRLARQFPEEVKIIAQNSDGSVFAHVPEKWVKVAKPREGHAPNLTPEQKAANAERLRQMTAAKRASKAAVQ